MRFISTHNVNGRLLWDLDNCFADLLRLRIVHHTSGSTSKLFADTL